MTAERTPRRDRATAVPGSTTVSKPPALLDGALVLKVWRSRESGQVRVTDGAAFDPATSGLEVARGHGVGAASGWARIESVERILTGR